MKIITLNENNRQAQLDAPDAEIARQMKKKNPGLPFSLSENILRFAEYTVGSLNIGDTQINITTRNAAFTLDKVLQMMLYIQGVKSNLGATELGVGQSGISGISFLLLFCYFAFDMFGMSGFDFCGFLRAFLLNANECFAFYNY